MYERTPGWLMNVSLCKTSLYSSGSFRKRAVMANDLFRWWGEFLLVFFSLLLWNHENGKQSWQLVIWAMRFWTDIDRAREDENLFKRKRMVFWKESNSLKINPWTRFNQAIKSRNSNCIPRCIQHVTKYYFGVLVFGQLKNHFSKLNLVQSWT